MEGRATQTSPWSSKGRVETAGTGPLRQPRSFPGEKDPGGALRGPSPSVDGLVVRVALPPGEEERAAAHQEHQQRGAQGHGHDGDDKRGEGVLGGLPKAQQH